MKRSRYISADPPTGVARRGDGAFYSARQLHSRSGGAVDYIRIVPPMLLTFALLMPPEVRINLGGQNLYAYRIAWIILFPLVVRDFAIGRQAFRLNDVLVTIGAAWVTVSFVVVYGVAIGIPSGVAVTLDIIMPYFVGRTSIRDIRDFRRFLVILSPFVFVLSVLLPIEAFTHYRFVRNGAATIFGGLGVSEFGQSSAFLVASDSRWGMLRAMGPFSHPILAGIFFSSLLPLYHFSKIKGSPKLIGFASGFGSIFSLSSAAFLQILIFITLALYNYISRSVTFLSWRIFIFVTSISLASLHVVSQNGIFSILIRYTMDPATGRYRLLIWEHGVNSVAKHPWVGIGYAKFEALPWMGDSIDAFWLHLAVRNGLPASILILLAAVCAVVANARTASRHPDPDHSTLMGMSITLLLLIISGFTVSIFGGLTIWFVLLLGFATTLGSGREELLSSPLMNERGK